MRTCTVNGQPVLVDKSWSITGKINARSTLNIKVVDLLNLSGIEEGDSIEIYSDSTKIYSGVILSISKEEPYRGRLVYSINAVDNSALADKRVIAKVYENKTAGYIAEDLISEKLYQEGVTAGDIADGPVMRKAVFNYIKCSEALDYIKRVTGLNWNIDKDRKLNLFDRATYTAPFPLTDKVQHSNFRQKSSLDKYRNVQYVRGGRGRTATQYEEVPTPKPDGESRNFIVRFPLAEQPIIEVNVAGGGWETVDPDDIGVNGLDKEKKWYFSFGSQVITQDTAETPLDSANGDSIRITYVGLRNLFVVVDNPVEISSRAEKETGTSGVYEALSKETSIDDAGQAIEYAQGLIQTYGEITDTISFQTEVPGLEAGQLLPVNKPLYGINDDFLIETVNIRPSGPSSIVYSVSALDGAAVGGWEEFFKELIKGNREFVIAENEVIILLNTQTENIGHKSSTNIKMLENFFPSEDLYPSETLHPGILKGEVTINE